MATSANTTIWISYIERPQMNTFAQDPDATYDYKINWKLLMVELGGDTIDSSSWSVTGDATVSNASASDTATVIFVGDGTAGNTVTVTNHITTTGGRTYEKSFKVYFKQE